MTMRLDATFTVDGSAGTAELRKSAAALSDLKLKEIEAGAAARQASAGVRELEKELQRAGKSSAEMDARLLAARQEMARTQLAATEASRAFSRFEAEQRRGSEGIVNGASRSRAAYQQLGFQISDVAAQAAVGTNPMIIFAQQGGQVAQALAGAGGVLGRVATFLAGPWGAAVLGAGAILGVLVAKQNEAAGASDAVAEAAERQKKAIEELDRVNQQQRESDELRIQRLGREAQARLTVLAATRRQIEAALNAQLLVEKNALRRAEDPTLAGEGGFNPGAAAAFQARRRIGDLQGALAANSAASAEDQSRVRAAAFAAAQTAAKAATDAVTAATQRYNAELVRLRNQYETGAISQAALTDGLIRAERDLSSAKDAASAAEKAVKDRARGVAKAARDAAREAREEAQEAAKAWDLLRRSIDKARNFDAFEPGAVRKAEESAQRARETDSLAKLVDQAEERLPQVGARMGRSVADAASAEMLRNAGAIGQAIGGPIGNIVQTAAGILEGIAVGDFRGIGGRAGGALTLFAGATTKETWKPVVEKLDKIFGGESGDGTFLKKFGSVLQDAAFGAGVAGLVGKGTREEMIGGAIGAAVGAEAGKALEKLGVPMGEVIGKVGGALLGTALGGLFVKVRSGSVAVTGSGGRIGVGEAVGTGRSQKDNATRMGTGISDAIQQIVDQLGGTVGDFAVSIGQIGGKFRVDPTGQGRVRKRQSGVLAFGEDGDAAFAAALEDALKDGAVAGVSPRVQAALQKFAGDVNRAVAEALKVQDLENFLSDRGNPFGRAFREFERQAADRLKIARQYGFDVVEIERVNAEERAKLLKEQLADTTASARALLNDLRFGGRAEGSVSQRLAALGSERSRLEGLVAGGDVSQIDALTGIIQQQLDLSRQAFGSTGQFAADRGGAISALETLIRQTEDRINAASAAAQNPTVDKLTELNTTADEQVTELQRQTALLEQLARAGGPAGFTIGAFARTPV